MKSRRSGMILMLLGAVIAVMVAVMVYNVTRAASSETKIETIDVVVTSRDIPERTIVPAEGLVIRQLPVDAAPPGAVTTLDQAVGKMTVTRLYPGELVLAAKLADTKGQSGMAFALEKGKVLITFPASDIVTTGAIRVGDTVDLLVTYRGASQAASGQPQAQPSQTESIPPTTQTTMQNLKIVSMGASAAKAGASAGSNLVTFALEPQDALILKAIKDADGMSLEVVLRAAGDEEIVKTQPVTIRTILERYRLRTP